MIRLFAMFAIALCASASAGAVSCPSETGVLGHGYLAVDPVGPDSSQVITFTAGIYSHEPTAIDVQVHGNIVDITLTAVYRSLSLPGSCLTATIGPLPPGQYTVNYWLFVTNLLPSATVLLMSNPLRVTGPGALSGLWWNPSESGWGINFVQRENVVFAAWFTYDSAGRPKWYVAPHCSLPAPVASGSCRESLYEVNGPIFFGAAFDPYTAHVSSVGTLTLDFMDADTASMEYALEGQTRRVLIMRQALPISSPLPQVNYTDLWWNPAESGWGLAVTHVSNAMFLAWYVYDEGGKPIWYVAPNCGVNSSGSGCSGTLYRTAGPSFGPVFDSSKVQVFAAGMVSLSFSSSNYGSLNFTVNGVSSSKSITRQVF